VSQRYDDRLHAYYLDEVRVPSITQMLTADGEINATWFTEESRVRGTAVHDLAARFALGALERDEYEGAYRGYFLAHVEAMKLLRPEVLHVEIPWCHRRYRFGGRLDLVVRLYGALSVVELKSGDRLPWHGVQTALQAMLVEQETGVPATSVRRYGLHLKADGRFKLDPHEQIGDFGKAKNILARHACRMDPWEPAEVW